MTAPRRRGRRLALAALGLALAGVVAAVALALGRGGGGAAVTPATERAAAPAATFVLEDGARRSLASFRGRPAVVAFVLPYCATCIDTLRMLDTVAAERPGQAAPIAVSVGTGGAGQLRAFAADVGATKALYVADPGFRAAQALGVTEVDTVVVIDAAGRVVTRGPQLSAGTVLGALAAS